MSTPYSSIGHTAISPIDNPPPVLYLHCGIFLAGNKIIGDEMFRLVEFKGKESVSEPFEFELELHANTAPQSGQPLNFSQVIGRPLTVGINLPTSEARDISSTRFQQALQGQAVPTLSLFNGMVASFGMDIPGVYRLTMRPMLWRMTLTNRYCVHPQMNIHDTLRGLLDEHRIVYSLDGITGEESLAMCRVQDWLQAGETDFEFMRRLMGKAHIYYYFEHTGSSHKVVFANRPVYPPVFDPPRALRYTYTSVDELGLVQSDVVFDYRYQQNLISTGVKGVFTNQENAWENPTVAQQYNYHASIPADVGELPFNQYKIFQYGCSDNEVRHFIKATSDALRATASQLSGGSYCSRLRVGRQFSMTGKDMADMNPMPVRPEFEGQNFVLTEVQHEASADGRYKNQFQAVEADGLISAISVQDTQQGAVLAVVTDKNGNASVEDWPYYTPDDFNPATEVVSDSQGVTTAISAQGVFVRFSTDDPTATPVWVKLAPHMQVAPEIGASVWISRANDESELPEIQSIVQADGSTVVTPTLWTAHTQVGSSYSTTYGDGKNIRFGVAWTKALVDEAVSIITNAYATKKYREASYARGATYNYTTSETKEQGLLSDSFSFGSTHSHSWGKESKSFSAEGRNYHESVIGKYDTSLDSTEASDADALAAVTTNKSTVYGKSYTNNTNNGDTKAIAATTGNSISTTTNTGNVTSTSTVTGTSTTTATHDGKVTSTTTINASSVNDTTITGTSNSTSTHKGKVSNTTTIKADSDTDTTVTGTSTTTNTQNIVHTTSTAKVQTNSNAVGVNNSNDAMGVVNANSATAVSNRNSVTAVTLDISGGAAEKRVTALGYQSSLNLIGYSSTVNIMGGGTTFSSEGAVASMKLQGADVQITLIKLIL